MTENTDLTNIPQATAEPKKRRRLSIVWIIPILAAVVALGIAVQRILSEGPTITIVFKTAEGIEAGKTNVKYKDVNIGLVKTVKLSEDFTKVVLTAKIDKSAEGLIVEDAKFWVESPRVSLSGISGIGTLLSGNYIGMEAGKSTEKRRDFIGLEVPPTITDQPGREFVLQADELGSVGIGAPVYYRKFNVGQVIGYDLAEDGRSVNIKVFVNAPYDKYVTSGTKFWQASGIDVTMGANGLTVQTQSVLSVLIGGIAFETPPTSQDTKPAAAKTVFPLYGDRNAAVAKHETIVVPYVLYFKEGLRGLTVGAPVTYLGLPVGEVTEIGFEYDEATERNSSARRHRGLPGAVACACEICGFSQCEGPYREGSPRLYSEAGQPRLPGTTAQRESLDGTALCRLRSVPECPEGEGRLDQGAARAAGHAGRDAGSREQAHQYHGQDRQSAL